MDRDKGPFKLQKPSLAILIDVSFRLTTTASAFHLNGSLSPVDVTNKICRLSLTSMSRQDRELGLSDLMSESRYTAKPKPKLGVWIFNHNGHHGH